MAAGGRELVLLFLLLGGNFLVSFVLLAVGCSHWLDYRHIPEEREKAVRFIRSGLILFFPVGGPIWAYHTWLRSP